MRARHGSTDARSSMTMATRGFLCTSRYFLRCAKPCPQTSIVSVSGL
jgi:hypothetical protein